MGEAEEKELHACISGKYIVFHDPRIHFIKKKRGKSLSRFSCKVGNVKLGENKNIMEFIYITTRSSISTHSKSSSLL
jgi:hypothetical protein